MTAPTASTTRIYDNHHWVARIGDPGFRYHETMTKLWGVMALRLANADVLPLDYRPYAAAVTDFEKDLEKAWVAKAGTPDAAAALEPLRTAIAGFGQAASTASDAATAGLASGDATTLAALNHRLMQAERGLLDPEGIPGRPWYRHQIYAPKPTYAPELLPALNEAIDSGDAGKVATAATKIAAALDRASRTLRGQ